MYEITWIDCEELFNVRTRDYRAAEALFFSLERRANPRMWQWGDDAVRHLSDAHETAFNWR